MNENNQYPDGKINENDDGKANIKIFKQGRVVIIEFEKKLKWFGLEKEKLVSFIKLLIGRYNELVEDEK